MASVVEGYGEFSYLVDSINVGPRLIMEGGSFYFIGDRGTRTEVDEYRYVGNSQSISLKGSKRDFLDGELPVLIQIDGFPTVIINVHNQMNVYVDSVKLYTKSCMERTGESTSEDLRFKRAFEIYIPRFQGVFGLLLNKLSRRLNSVNFLYAKVKIDPRQHSDQTRELKIWNVSDLPLIVAYSSKTSRKV